MSSIPINPLDTGPISPIIPEIEVKESASKYGDTSFLPPPPVHPDRTAREITHAIQKKASSTLEDFAAEYQKIANIRPNWFKRILRWLVPGLSMEYSRSERLSFYINDTAKGIFKQISRLQKQHSSLFKRIRNANLDEPAPNFTQEIKTLDAAIQEAERDLRRLKKFVGHLKQTSTLEQIVFKAAGFIQKEGEIQELSKKLKDLTPEGTQKPIGLIAENVIPSTQAPSISNEGDAFLNQVLRGEFTAAKLKEKGVSFYHQLISSLGHQAFTENNLEAQQKLVILIATLTSLTPNLLKQIRGETFSSSRNSVVNWRLDQACHDIPKVWLALASPNQPKGQPRFPAVINSFALADQYRLVIKSLALEAYRHEDFGLARSILEIAKPAARFRDIADAILKNGEFRPIQQVLQSLARGKPLRSGALSTRSIVSQEEHQLLKKLHDFSKTFARLGLELTYPDEFNPGEIDSFNSTLLELRSLVKRISGRINLYAAFELQQLRLPEGMAIAPIFTPQEKSAINKMQEASGVWPNRANQLLSKVNPDILISAFAKLCLKKPVDFPLLQCIQGLQVSENFWKQLSHDHPFVFRVINEALKEAEKDLFGPGAKILIADLRISLALNQAANIKKYQMGDVGLEEVQFLISSDPAIYSQNFESSMQEVLITHLTDAFDQLQQLQKQSSSDPTLKEIEKKFKAIVDNERLSHLTSRDLELLDQGKANLSDLDRMEKLLRFQQQSGVTPEENQQDLLERVQKLRGVLEADPKRSISSIAQSRGDKVPSSDLSLSDEAWVKFADRALQRVNLKLASPSKQSLVSDQDFIQNLLLLLNYINHEDSDVTPFKTIKDNLTELFQTHEEIFNLIVQGPQFHSIAVLERIQGEIVGWKKMKAVADSDSLQLRQRSSETTGSDNPAQPVEAVVVSMPEASTSPTTSFRAGGDIKAARAEKYLQDINQLLHTYQELTPIKALVDLKKTEELDRVYAQFLTLLSSNPAPEQIEAWLKILSNSSYLYLKLKNDPIITNHPIIRGLAHTGLEVLLRSYRSANPNNVTDDLDDSASIAAQRFAKQMDRISGDVQRLRSTLDAKTTSIISRISSFKIQLAQLKLEKQIIDKELADLPPYDKARIEERNHWSELGEQIAEIEKAISELEKPSQG